METQSQIANSDFLFLSPPSGSDDSVLTTGHAKWPKRKRRHIPHSQRPYEFVKRRNLREKRRVENLNCALESLRRCIPSTQCNAKESKINILREATEYIAYLNHVLSDEKPKEVTMDDFPLMFNVTDNSRGIAESGNVHASSCQTSALHEPSHIDSYPLFSPLNQVRDIYN